METDEFARLLSIGLGRPAIYLRKAVDLPYQDLLAAACLENWAYESTLGAEWTDYLYDIVQFTVSPTHYCDLIIDAISQQAATSWESFHPFDLLHHFAQDGHTGAQRFLYEHLDESLNAGVDWCAGLIIRLDGEAGFHTVFKRIAAAPPFTDPLDYEPLLWEIEEHVGRSRLKELMSALADDYPRLKPIFDIFIEETTRRSGRWLNRQSPLSGIESLTYQEIRGSILDPESRITHTVRQRWIQQAGPADVAQMAYDLLALDPASDPALLEYLRLFRFRPFPLDFQPLIRWAKRAIPESAGGYHEAAPQAANLPVYALNALAQISHHDVRRLAMEMIHDGRAAGRAVALLARNFEEGDWLLIEKLTRQERTPDDLHALGFGVQTVFGVQPSPEGLGALLNLYEHGPCPLCREVTLELLNSLGAVLPWMWEEAAFDSNPRIRDMADHHLKPSSQVL